MAKFFADWRNSVLIVTTIGTLVFGYLLLTGSQAFSPTVITVGAKSFTERDVVKELKDRAGFPIVSDMITSELLQQYAASHDITLTDSDVDQLVDLNKRQYEMSGTTLEDALASQGMTLSTFRKTQQLYALETKILLTPDEMKAAVAQAAKAGPPFAFPKRYLYRAFTFADEGAANAAIALLGDRTEASLNRVLADSANPGESRQVRMFVSGSNPKNEAIFKGLQPHECSKPMAFAAGENKAYNFIQLVDIEPAVIPTYENSNIAAGFAYWRNNMAKYASRLREIEGQVLDKVDMQFVTVDYDNVKKFFTDIKVKNPVIPGSKAPGANQPGQVPAARPPAQGKR